MGTTTINSWKLTDMKHASCGTQARENPGRPEVVGCNKCGVAGLRTDKDWKPKKGKTSKPEDSKSKAKDKPTDPKGDPTD